MLKPITAGALILGVSYFISAILGLLRDRLLASQFGAGEALDVYFAAFRIPDLVYGILIMGGLSFVFLPVLAEYFHRSEEQGWELVNVVLNSFLILLIVFCGILAVLTPWLIEFVAPGFSSEQKELAVPLIRLMFLSPILFGISSIFSGVLHYFNRFVAYSLAPVLYNLGIILGIIFFVPVFGIMGLGLGVILGAFSHWAIQIPSAKAAGFRYSFLPNFKYPGLLKIFKFMAWRTVGASVHHINLVFITAVASTLALGSITVFNFASNIAQFAVGIIGISFATAAFPTLSRAFVNGTKEEFLSHFSSTFKYILFWAVPASVVIFLLRNQIINTILGAGRFGAQDVQLTSAALGLFSIGIFAFALSPLLARAFFSMQDVKTPTITALIYMGLTITASLFFVWLLTPHHQWWGANAFQQFLAETLNLQSIENIQVVGLPLAVSISGIIYFSLLLLFLRKKLR